MKKKRKMQCIFRWEARALRWEARALRWEARALRWEARALRWEAKINFQKIVHAIT